MKRIVLNFLKLGSVFIPRINCWFCAWK